MHIINILDILKEWMIVFTRDYINLTLRILIHRIIFSRFLLGTIYAISSLVACKNNIKCYFFIGARFPEPVYMSPVHLRYEMIWNMQRNVSRLLTTSGNKTSQYPDHLRQVYDSTAHHWTDGAGYCVTYPHIWVKRNWHNACTHRHKLILEPPTTLLTILYNLPDRTSSNCKIVVASFILLKYICVGVGTKRDKYVADKFINSSNFFRVNL